MTPYDIITFPKPVRIYIEGLILGVNALYNDVMVFHKNLYGGFKSIGVNTLYMLCCFSKLFCKELSFLLSADARQSSVGS